MAIKKEDGWIYNENDIVKYFVENFQDLYQLNYPRMPLEMEKFREEVITEVGNEKITQVPSKEAVWSLHPLKSPGLDGFSGIFFWKILVDYKEQIHQLCSGSVSVGLCSN